MNLRQYLMGRKCRGFKPGPRYNETGDTLTIWLSDEDSYMENSPGGVDVYRGMKTGQITGLKVYGVSKLVSPRTCP